MGTNYYVKTAPACPTCGHMEGRGLHIGKSSAGWRFLLAGHKGDPNLTTWARWKAFLAKPGVEIVDEYGVDCPTAHFVNIVEHEVRNRTMQDGGERSDPEGYPFVDVEFS